MRSPSARCRRCGRRESSTAGCAIAAARKLASDVPPPPSARSRIAWAALSLAAKRIAVAESTRAAADADRRAAAAEAERARAEEAVNEARARLDETARHARRPRGDRARTLAGGCSCSPAARTPARGRHRSRSRPHFAQADAQRAKQDAPDLYARAERAYQDARSAGATTRAPITTTRARILLEAAIAEADRIALERAATAADIRAEQAVLQRAELERERLDLERVNQTRAAPPPPRAKKPRTRSRIGGDEQASPAAQAKPTPRASRPVKFVRDVPRSRSPPRSRSGSTRRAASDRQGDRATEHAATPTARLAAANHALARRRTRDRRGAQSARRRDTQETAVADRARQGARPGPRAAAARHRPST